MPAPEQPPEEAARRERMKEHLDRLAELRRGGATFENNAELRAVRAAVERRRRSERGPAMGA